MMEWDKIWAINKQKNQTWHAFDPGNHVLSNHIDKTRIDPVVPRYPAVADDAASALVLIVETLYDAGYICFLKIQCLLKHMSQFWPVRPRGVFLFFVALMLLLCTGNNHWGQRFKTVGQRVGLKQYSVGIVGTADGLDFL